MVPPQQDNLVGISRFEIQYYVVEFGGFCAAVAVVAQKNNGPMFVCFHFLQKTALFRYYSEAGQVAVKVSDDECIADWF